MDFNNVTTTVKVPICIQPALITSVHLDGSWSAPAGLPADELVRLPNGYIVGVHCPAVSETQQVAMR